MLKHIVHVVHNALRERAKRSQRSPQWPRVEKAFLVTHSSCAACGLSKSLNVHHRKPFHLHPELELDPANLIALCMGPNECHLRVGHGDNFRAYNPNVDKDAAESLANASARQSIWARAKLNRLMA